MSCGWAWAAALERLQLVRGRHAIERRVAVRKTAESIDERLVLHGMARPVLIAQRPDQIERQRLVHAIFAMFEGKVQKVAFLLFHDDVEFAFDGGSGEPARDA